MPGRMLNDSTKKWNRAGQKAKRGENCPTVSPESNKKRPANRNPRLGSRCLPDVRLQKQHLIQAASRLQSLPCEIPRVFGSLASHDLSETDRAFPDIAWVSPVGLKIHPELRRCHVSRGPARPTDRYFLRLNGRSHRSEPPEQSRDDNYET